MSVLFSPSIAADDKFYILVVVLFRIEVVIPYGC